MQEQNKLLTVIFSTTETIDKESAHYRRILSAKLKYDEQFDLQLVKVPLNIESVTEIVQSCTSKYIVFIDEKHEVSANYLKTLIDFLAIRTVYLAEPYMYFDSIPKDPTKTELNNAYFYSRDTDIYGVAYNTRRLSDLLEATQDIDKSSIYLTYRLYWSLPKVKPLPTGYSIANNTRAVIGATLEPTTRRLFPLMDTNSQELKTYILRFLTVYLRGLRTTNETNVSPKHLTEVVQKYDLQHRTSLLGPMQQFEAAWIDWLNNPTEPNILFKYLTDKDAYLNFEISEIESHEDHLYCIKIQNKFLVIKRVYRDHQWRPDYTDPSVYDFYSRKITSHSTILFYDRPMQADDNAEYLYSYFMEHHEEYANCYFALNPKSPDWPRLENKGFKLIPVFSKNFYELFLESDVVISSQIYNLKYKGKTLKNSRMIYLQHGIQLNDMSDWINSKQFDIFVATGKPEEEYIKSCAPIETLNSGLPRLETLKRIDTGKRQILFMPTWRFNLNTVSDQQFIESDYYKSINQLMTDDRIIRYLIENEITLQVKLHPNILSRTHLFNFSSNVVNCQLSYREAVSSSEFALTDFSSVVLDAAFIDVPIAYYQWDAKTFFKEQPYENRLDYETEGLGPVFYAADQAIHHIVNGDYKKSTESYKGRKELFFEGVEQTRINYKIVERMMRL